MRFFNSLGNNNNEAELNNINKLWCYERNSFVAQVGNATWDYSLSHFTEKPHLPNQRWIRLQYTTSMEPGIFKS